MGGFVIDLLPGLNFFHFPSHGMRILKEIKSHIAVNKPTFGMNQAPTPFFSFFSELQIDAKGWNKIVGNFGGLREK